MARIFYGVCGEGRGHATRARTIVEALRDRHEIVLFAYGDAQALLATAYQGTATRVVAIPGLRFQYGPRRGMSPSRTAAAAIRYLTRLPALVASLAREFARSHPDLVVSDFEPALPRAARRACVPVVTLDHQHFLTTEDLSSLPASLRVAARVMALGVAAYAHDPEETVVSSFQHLPLRPGANPVTQVGVLLRPAIRSARPEPGTHLVVYLRPSAPPRVLDALEDAAIEAHVYGRGARPARGRLTFHETSEEHFPIDLARCRALVTTAGNQLLGEALYLGKPVLAMPEEGQYEQAINAFLLDRSGCGESVALRAFTPDRLDSFLTRADAYAAASRRQQVDGTAAAVQAICRHLPRVARGPVGERVRAGGRPAPFLAPVRPAAGS